MNHPNRFICPISKLIFFEPILCADGFNYEQDYIVAHFKNSNISPMTGKYVKANGLPNKVLQLEIREYLEQNKEAKEDQYYNNTFDSNIDIICRYIENKEWDKLSEFIQYDLGRLYLINKLEFLKDLPNDILLYILDNSLNVLNDADEIAVILLELGLEENIMSKYINQLGLYAYPNDNDDLPNEINNIDLSIGNTNLQTVSYVDFPEFDGNLNRYILYNVVDNINDEAIIRQTIVKHILSAIYFVVLILVAIIVSLLQFRILNNDILSFIDSNATLTFYGGYVILILAEFILYFVLSWIGTIILILSSRLMCLAFLRCGIGLYTVSFFAVWKLHTYYGMLTILGWYINPRPFYTIRNKCEYFGSVAVLFCIVTKILLCDYLGWEITGNIALVLYVLFALHHFICYVFASLIIRDALFNGNKIRIE